MLVKIEARILIFPGTDFHFPSTSVPPGTFFRLWLKIRLRVNVGIRVSCRIGVSATSSKDAINFRCYKRR